MSVFERLDGLLGVSVDLSGGSFFFPGPFKVTFWKEARLAR